MLVMAVLIGGLISAGLYLMLRRSVAKLIFGIVLLGHAVNLIVFASGGLVHAGSPVIEEGRKLLEMPHPDPLPQALVLTAIVIGFSVQAFAIVLIKRAHQEAKTDDFDRMDTTERCE